MTTEATDITAPDAPTTDTDTETVDWKAEAEKYKALHRKQEERAKANQAAVKELEQLRQQSMTDSEKAIAQARAEARTETLREVGSSLVAAEVRVAAAGRPVDVDALLEGIDVGRFIGDDGQPDRKSIGAWLDRVAPKGEPTKAGFPDLGQGARGQQGSLGPAEEFAKFIQAQRKG